MKRKFLIPISISPLSVIPLATIVSCSNFANAKFVYLNDSVLYGEIWNTSMVGNEKIEFSEMTLRDIEKIVNQKINNDKKIKKIIQAYLVQFLLSSISSPYDRSGKPITNKNTELQDIETYLKNDVITPDDKNADEKTFKKLNSFIESVSDIKLNILFFSKNKDKKIELNNDIKLKEAITLGNKNRLNFQFDFKINDTKLNELLIKSKGFLKNRQTREEIKEIRKIKKTESSKEIIDLIENQYTYQGTKMHYDINNQTFKTIVLPSNMDASDDRPTSDSGFNEVSDKKRKLFYFDWKEISSNKYNSYLIMKLSDNNYFNTSIFPWWRDYLEAYKLLEKNKTQMVDIDFSLDKYIYFKKNNA